MPKNSTLLCNYIRRREVLYFVYDGAGRTVEPHLLGTDADGDLTLSAWQRSGPTPSGWRDFHVKKMRNISPVGRNFRSARPGYNREDTTIQNIICRVSSGRRKK